MINELIIFFSGLVFYTVFAIVLYNFCVYLRIIPSFKEEKIHRANTMTSARDDSSASREHSENFHGAKDNDSSANLPHPETMARFKELFQSLYGARTAAVSENISEQLVKAYEKTRQTTYTASDYYNPENKFDIWANPNIGRTSLTPEQKIFLRWVVRAQAHTSEETSESTSENDAGQWDRGRVIMRDKDKLMNRTYH